MAEQVTMPQLGLTMDEGTVFEWSKKENDPVKKGDVLLVVENDKSTVDVESQYEGILGKILVAEGETVPVGAPIAWIVAEGEEVPADSGGAAGTEEAEAAQEAPAAAAETGTEETAEALAAEKPAAEAGTAPQGGAAKAGTAADGFVLASPRARALAAEKGVELEQIAGSGPEGSVLEKDVLAAVESGAAAPAAAAATAAPGAPVYATASGKTEEISLTRIQAVGAERMVESWQNVPQFTLQREIDAEALLRLQSHFRDTRETKISLNIVLAKIFSHAIAAHPRLNAEWIGNGKIRQHPAVNVGIAMDTANGLMVPVLKDCTTRGFAALARDWQATAETVKAGKAGPAELTGATVTLSNLGMFGVGWFRAIVNPPQAAILALGGVERKPVETASGIAFRSVIQATITADHRVVDGAYAARFMQSFAKMVENPVLIYEGV